MKKPKFDLANAISGMGLEPAGFAHALNLLLLAIGKGNPAVGALLDEFTALHADYLAQLQALARESNSDEHLQALENFSQSARLIYKRLSALDAEQSAILRAGLLPPATSMSIH